MRSGLGAGLIRALNSLDLTGAIAATECRRLEEANLGFWFLDGLVGWLVGVKVPGTLSG